jgi:hypothetical protein
MNITVQKKGTYQTHTKKNSVLRIQIIIALMMEAVGTCETST